MTTKLMFLGHCHVKANDKGRLVPGPMPLEGETTNEKNSERFFLII